MAKTKALAAQASAAIMDWGDEKILAEIKTQYGANLSETEWRVFMGIGKATGLNPFMREVWCIKYGTKPATIFIGRDGYRRSAQNHPEYEYHYAMAVHSNDVFGIKNGIVEHTMNVKDPGELIGAYCVVKRKSASVAVCNYISCKEYRQQHGVWETKPATMAVKVAEAQGLRASFQELFAGTYEESESWQEEKPAAANVEVMHVHTLDASELPASVRVMPARPEDVQFSRPDTDTRREPTDEEYEEWRKTLNVTTAAEMEPKEPKRTPEQNKLMRALWAEYEVAANVTGVESDTRRKALMQSMFGVETSINLTVKQADELIKKIRELTYEATL